MSSIEHQPVRYGIWHHRGRAITCRRLICINCARTWIEESKDRVTWSVRDGSQPCECEIRRRATATPRPCDAPSSGFTQVAFPATPGVSGDPARTK